MVSRGRVWLTRRAHADLSRVPSAAQDGVLNVIGGHLNIPIDPNDPDEASDTVTENRQTTIYYARRAITNQQRQELNAAESRGDDHDDYLGRSWDYVIVYRKTTSSECIQWKQQHGIVVERIVDNGKLIQSSGIFVDLNI